MKWTDIVLFRCRLLSFYTVVARILLYIAVGTNILCFHTSVSLSACIIITCLVPVLPSISLLLPVLVATMR